MSKVIREGFGNVPETLGIIRDGLRIIRDPFGTIRRHLRVIRDLPGTIPETFGIVRDGFRVIRDLSGIIRKGSGAILDRPLSVSQRLTCAVALLGMLPYSGIPAHALANPSHPGRTIYREDLKAHIEATLKKR